LHCETLLLRKLPQLPVPILESDIIGMKARVRHMNIIGMFACLLACYTLCTQH